MSFYEDLVMQTQMNYSRYYHVYIHSFRFAQAQNVMKMVFLSLFFRYNSCS